MPWARYDDGFYDHPKVEEVLGGDADVDGLDESELLELVGLAAVGLHVLTNTYACRHLTDGHVAPAARRKFARLTGDMLSERLVDAGLWHLNGNGHVIHDFEAFNPTKAEVEAKRDAAKARMEALRARRRAEREAKAREESEESDPPRDADVRANQRERSREVRVAPTRPDPTPTTRPSATPQDARPAGLESVSGEVVDETPRWESEEVVALCDLLADLIAEAGDKRPTVTKDWKVECERLLRIDGASVQQVQYAIRWTQGDAFWRRNVLSMPKLRKQWTRIKREIQAAIAKSEARPTARGQRAADRQAERMARAAALEAVGQ